MLVWAFYGIERLPLWLSVLLVEAVAMREIADFVVFRVCYCLYLVQCTKDPVAYRRCGDLSNDLSALPLALFGKSFHIYLLKISKKKDSSRKTLARRGQRMISDYRMVCESARWFFRKYAALFPPDRPLLLGIEWAVREKPTEAMLRPQYRDSHCQSLQLTHWQTWWASLSFSKQPSQSLACRASWQVSCSSSLQLKSLRRESSGKDSS